MQGQIDENLHLGELSLSGEAELTGPCRLAKVATNGFALKVSTPAHHGISIDGFKDPADWGPNVVFTVPVYESNASYSLPVLQRDKEALALRERILVSSGGDGLEAFEWLAARIAAFEETRDEAKGAWIAQSESSGNKIHFDSAIDAFLAAYELSGWPALSSFIRSKTLDAWKGLEVETGRVF